MSKKPIASPIAIQSVPSRPLLLVIDDDPVFQKQIDVMVSGRYRVESSLAAVADDAPALTHADTIILDLNMPGIDGLSFIKTVAMLNPKPKLLIASGHEEAILELARSSALMYGIDRTEVLRKPVSRESLFRILEKLDRLPSEARVRSALVQTFSDDEVVAGFAAGQFVVVYQPQVALSSNEVVGLEALVRWDHPLFGSVLPANFVEQIVDSASAECFTLAIAEIAARDALKLGEIGLDALKISINVPPHVLASDTFSDRLISCLREYGCAPRRFQCEMTEQGMESLSPAVLSNLARLRMNGVQLSLDDFGIGQSGLAKLKSRAFDELKIDGSFIRDLAISAESRSIVESMVQLSRCVDMRIIAEGVENEATIEWTKLLGVNIIQGYFFAKPMSLEKLLPWLLDWSRRKRKLVEIIP